jgi:tRNA pseudouridine38-40 synthase
MVRLKCEIAYDGTDFCGWQIQQNERTVQGVVEEALARIHKKSVRVTASGRTDAGVHAVRQVIHFDSDLAIPEEGWKKALNTLLPNDVVIRSVHYVHDDFHARFDVVKKEYRYRVLIAPEPDVFRRRYTYHVPFDLDVASMCEAADNLVGKHDFSSFCAAGSDVENKVRKLETVDITENEDELMFRLVSNGFLYQMVRIIVGTLLEVGRGKLSPHDIIRILNEKDRTEAGPTVPGRGLTLWKVVYDTRGKMSEVGGQNES